MPPHNPETLIERGPDLSIYESKRHGKVIRCTRCHVGFVGANAEERAMQHVRTQHYSVPLKPAQPKPPR